MKHDEQKNMNKQNENKYKLKTLLQVLQKYIKNCYMQIIMII